MHSLRAAQFTIIGADLVIDCPSYSHISEMWADRHALAAAVALFPQVRAIRLTVGGAAQYPTIKIQNQAMTQLTSDFLETITAVALSLKASVFLLDYDGTYLEYLSAGLDGNPIVSYSEMIGQKAMHKLPEPMRSTCLHWHDLAVSSGQSQRYTYTSPARSREMATLLVPFPDRRVIACLVMELATCPVPI
jgi:hypothetical protein